ncbi:MAG: ribonuclease T2 [Methylocystis sp.]
MTRPRFGPSASASGEFDFYVLALSWSPGFCELSGGGRSQCEPGARLGFVVHGLWPQYEHGFPSNCGGSPTVSRMALDRAKGVYPDDGLARYEWRKHGTCTGLSPGDYFDSVARAKSLVTIPQNFQNFSADQTFATQDVERAFIEANPRLRPGMMSVGCQRGLLQEVRICVTKDLRDFRACPEVARGGCHSREIRATAPY